MRTPRRRPCGGRTSARGRACHRVCRSALSSRRRPLARLPPWPVGLKQSICLRPSRRSSGGAVSASSAGRRRGRGSRRRWRHLQLTHPQCSRRYCARPKPRRAARTGSWPPPLRAKAWPAHSPSAEGCKRCAARGETQAEATRVRLPRPAVQAQRSARVAQVKAIQLHRHRRRAAARQAGHIPQRLRGRGGRAHWSRRTAAPAHAGREAHPSRGQRRRAIVAAQVRCRAQCRVTAQLRPSTLAPEVHPRG